MSKKKQNPSGLDTLVNNLYGNPYQGEEVSDLDNQVFDDPVEDIDKQNTTIDTPDPNANQVTEDGNADDLTVGNDDSKIPDDINNDPTKDNKDGDKDNSSIDDTVNDDNIDPSDEEVTEAQQVNALFDAVGESLGWNMADINEEDRPLTVDDLTKYLGKVVEQNSIPSYADDRVQQLDEYVKNGGKFEDFYQIQQQSLSLDNIDLESEDNQITVIKDLLKHSGYPNEQIDNKISRYQDADMLYEESQDALERLKTIRKDELERNAQQQKQIEEQQRVQQEEFFNSVTTDINNLDSIRGIAVPKEDRKVLYDYIFKVDQNGMSQYQKDFNQNLSKNLIESAYLTMKGDTLISGAKKTGETSATEKLRKLMRHQTKNHTRYNAQDKQKSATDLLNGMF